MSPTSQSNEPSRAQQAPHSSPKRGPIMAIGGAEERSVTGEILNEFVRNAGGSKARILVIPTASEDPEAGKDYVHLFEQMGANEVRICDIASREAANSDEVVDLITNMTGIYFSGGDQSRLSKFIVGTRLADVLRLQNSRGVTVAGTSAGASFLSANVMLSGDGDSAPRKGMAEMVSGLGLTSDVIIDQHFNARGRIGRLLVLFAGSPGLIALGIDENTAAVINPDGTVRAIGENSVFVIDGRDVYSDAFDRKQGEVISITGCSLHTMGRGRCFDLNQRCIIDLIDEQTGRGDPPAS